MHHHGASTETFLFIAWLAQGLLGLRPHHDPQNITVQGNMQQMLEKGGDFGRQ
jgi:hypothetical protein